MNNLKSVRSVLGSLLIHVSDERLCDVIKHQKPQIPSEFADDDQALAYLCADLLAFCGEIVPQGENFVKKRQSGEETLEYQTFGGVSGELALFPYKKMYQERILYLQRINGSYDR